MRRFVFVLILIGIGVGIYYYVKPKEVVPEPLPNEDATQPPNTQTDEPPVTTSGTKLIAQGKYKEAAKQIEKELKDCPANERPSLLNYLALAYERSQNAAKATETWQKLLSEHPSSQFCGNACYALGKNESEPDKQIEYYKTAVEKYPKSDGAVSAGLELGDYYMQSNLGEVEKQAKARQCFTLALKGNLSKEKKDAIKQKLALINRNLVFSPTVNPADSILYQIKKDENIWSISQKHKVPAGNDKEGQVYLGQIRRINHLKTANIRAGDSLKIITGKFTIEVAKKDFTLTLYLNGDYIREYPIAVGNPKEDPTPEGVFHILGTSKEVNPVWHRYDKTTGTTEVIIFGDPKHIIGTRWMAFKERERLGIHGTSDPASIGKAVTNGCIRMKNEDVEELFDLVPGDTEVIVRE